MTTYAHSIGRRSRSRRRDFRPFILLCLVTVGSAAAIINASPGARPVVLPMVALLALTGIYASAVIRRDHSVPVFELGSMFILVVAVYGIVPLVNYLAGGLQWGILSDNRLLAYLSSPAEVGAFAWNYVILLASFIAVYLWMRGRPPSVVQPLRPPAPGTIATIIVSTLALMAYFWVMEMFFDFSYSRGYTDIRAGLWRGGNLPYFVHQISHNLRGMLLVEKQLMIIVLVGHWKNLRYRVALGVWLACELAILLSRFGSRTELVMLVLTFVLLYHRLVRPLSIKVVAFGIATALASVVAYGLARDAVMSEGRPMISSTMAITSNEFQVLWTTAFDLTKRRELGTLGPVPWQIYLSDAYLVIPSGLLPFEKIDPSLWYLDVIDEHAGAGFMFGIISQSAVGFGWWELVLRGAVLAFVLAMIHRWYARHQRAFWATAFYVFLLSWIYYAFRGTTFYWIYFILYRFIPAMLVTIVISRLIGTPERRLATGHAQVTESV